MTRLRLAVAVTAVAAGAASFAPPASAMVCAPQIRTACETLGYACRTLSDNPKLGLECVPLH